MADADLCPPPRNKPGLFRVSIAATMTRGGRTAVRVPDRRSLSQSGLTGNQPGSTLAAMGSPDSLIKTALRQGVPRFVVQATYRPA